MPTNYCQFFFECTSCHQVLKPKLWHVLLFWRCTLPTKQLASPELNGYSPLHDILIGCSAFARFLRGLENSAEREGKKGENQGDSRLGGPQTIPVLEPTARVDTTPRYRILSLAKLGDRGQSVPPVVLLRVSQARRRRVAGEILSSQALTLKKNFLSLQKYDRARGKNYSPLQAYVTVCVRWKPN
jgi:hypothetical protein